MNDKQRRAAEYLAYLKQEAQQLRKQGTNPERHRELMQRIRFINESIL